MRICHLTSVHPTFAVKRPGRIRRIFVYTWKILFAALKTRSEIHHFHDPELFFVGVVLKCLGKKVIFDVHEIGPYSEHLAAELLERGED